MYIIINSIKFGFYSGPRFEKIGSCDLSLKDVDTSINTFELASEPHGEYVELCSG